MRGSVIATLTDNIAFDDRPVTLDATGPHLVILDPMVLDALRTLLPTKQILATTPPLSALAPFSGTQRFPLRIAVHQIPSFTPGRYELSARDFVAADDSVRGAETFDLDSGTAVVVDYLHLAQVAEALTWDIYDLACRQADDPNPIIEALNNTLGGPRFAIVSSVEGTAFAGDGSYSLRSDAPRRKP